MYPGGQKIASGQKTIEVRSWRSPEDLTGDLLIVENHRFLREEGEIDPSARPVALVKIIGVRDYVPTDVAAACASRWEPGYFSWDLGDIRALDSEEHVFAARGIYEVELRSIVPEGHPGRGDREPFGKVE